MLSLESKIGVLKNYLLDVKDANYADSFKTDILFYFNEFDEVQSIELNFLTGLETQDEIHKWVDNLASQIIMKFNEDEDQLSDFIFYTLNP